MLFFRKLFFAVLIFIAFDSFAQQQPTPKLVVGIVVDQMRYDYISRFWNHFGHDGFRKLVNNGFNCRNLHYNYGPTYTGPGHASIFSGATPRHHGVIANNWFDRETGRSQYCASDLSVRSVGQQSSQGQMSPRQMKVTTIADELKLYTSGRSKVIGISLKDRGATLSAGHAADAAYWMSDRWISSSYYMEQLPEWVNDFNSDLAKWVPDAWSTLKPIEQYDESGPDNNPYENNFALKESPVFPYNLKELMPGNGGIQMIKTTPFGNTITTEFAKAAVINEKLGQRGEVDFLSVSYSSPDYIGHMFGPQAKEVQDNYVRLDREIAGFISFLDEQVGVGEYLLFLTSDHGAAYVPAMLQDIKIPGGYLDVKTLNESIKQFFSAHFGADNWLLDYSNEQIFLDRTAISHSGWSADQVSDQLVEFLLQQDGVAEVYTANDLRRNEYTKGVAALLQNGFHPARSGDVMLVLEPGWLEYGRKGTTHGALWSYDTHVPAIFYGKGIRQGFSDEKLSITDIAPTICSLLQISFPNAVEGVPIRSIAEKH